MTYVDFDAARHLIKLLSFEMNIQTHIAAECHEGIQSVLLVGVFLRYAFVQLNDMNEVRKLYFFAPILIYLQLQTQDRLWMSRVCNECTCVQQDFVSRKLP